jgi:hypothetical protein
MDKSAFFAATRLQSTEYTVGDVTVTLRELSVADRATLFSHASDAGPKLAALTVALSCPDFSMDDVDMLMNEVQADVLMAMAEKVYLLSGISEGDDAKKG